MVKMIILSFETSCDDTCAAIIRAFGRKKPRFNVLSNIISSQIEIHKKWGGVYPALAKREHQKNLPRVLKKAIKEARGPKIDLVAVTAGPGLEPCLWAGINFAKEFSKKMQLPLIPVNHIEAHVFSSLIGKEKKEFFPAICLVVSGGHTQIVLTEEFGKYKVLGETRDDAAGECFDKTARILGLGYPGGPAIAKTANRATNFKSEIKMPRPMIGQKNYDFSFSGLKTAVLYDFKKRPKKTRESKEYIQKMCAEIQQAIIDVLVKKTVKAAKDHCIKNIILGGGVAANEELKKQFKEESQKNNFNLFFPEKKLCTDNAVMAGIVAYFKWLRKKEVPEKIEAEANAGLSICRF